MHGSSEPSCQTPNRDGHSLLDTHLRGINRTSIFGRTIGLRRPAGRGHRGQSTSANQSGKFLPGPPAVKFFSAARPAPGSRPIQFSTADWGKSPCQYRARQHAPPARPRKARWKYHEGARTSEIKPRPCLAASATSACATRLLQDPAAQPNRRSIAATAASTFQPDRGDTKAGSRCASQTAPRRLRDRALAAQQHRMATVKTQTCLRAEHARLLVTTPAHRKTTATQGRWRQSQGNSIDFKSSKASWRNHRVGHDPPIRQRQDPGPRRFLNNPHPRQPRDQHQPPTAHQRQAAPNSPRHQQQR